MKKPINAEFEEFDRCFFGCSRMVAISNKPADMIQIQLVVRVMISA